MRLPCLFRQDNTLDYLRYIVLNALSILHHLSRINAVQLQLFALATIHLPTEHVNELTIPTGFHKKILPTCRICVGMRYLPCDDFSQPIVENNLHTI